MSKELEKKNVFNTRSVVQKLEGYMDQVTKNECTPSTVQAAVNCADKICDFLRIHLEVERLRIKRGDIDE